MLDTLAKAGSMDAVLAGDDGEAGNFQLMQVILGHLICPFVDGKETVIEKPSGL
jgi:hypothetical protein